MSGFTNLLQPWYKLLYCSTFGLGQFPIEEILYHRIIFKSKQNQWKYIQSCVQCQVQDFVFFAVFNITHLWPVRVLVLLAVFLTVLSSWIIPFSWICWRCLNENFVFNGVLIHYIKFVGMHRNFGQQKLSAENDIFWFFWPKEKK